MRSVAAEADKGAPGRGPRGERPGPAARRLQLRGRDPACTGHVRDPAWGPFLTAVQRRPRTLRRAGGAGGRLRLLGADGPGGRARQGVRPRPGRKAPLGAARRGQTLGGSLGPNTASEKRRGASTRPPPGPAASLPRALCRKSARGGRTDATPVTLWPQTGCGTHGVPRMPRRLVGTVRLGAPAGSLGPCRREELMDLAVSWSVDVMLHQFTIRPLLAGGPGRRQQSPLRGPAFRSQPGHLAGEFPRLSLPPILRL